MSKQNSNRNSRGQSLLEAILMMPLMLGIILNAVNLGYFFFVTVNLTGATRTAAEYAMVGPDSPGTTTYPPACNKSSICPGSGPNVTDLFYQHLTGAVANATSATVQVCSAALGTNSTPAVANCIVCTSSSSTSCTSTTLSGTSPDADPESPTFILNRVDVKYQFKPLIPGSIFNLVLLNTAFSGGQYTFYRHIEMRAM